MKAYRQAYKEAYVKAYRGVKEAAVTDGEVWDYTGVLTVGTITQEGTAWGWYGTIGEGGIGSFSPNYSDCTGILYIVEANMIFLVGVNCSKLSVNGTVFTDATYNAIDNQTTFPCLANPFPAEGETCVTKFNTEPIPDEAPEGAIVTLNGDYVKTTTGDYVVAVTNSIPQGALTTLNGDYIKTLNNEFITI